MKKEQNSWNKWFFIQELPVILFGERDADPRMRKQIFIFADGQHMETLIGSII